MPVLDPQTSPNALAIASTAIVSALLDMLVMKEMLTVTEARSIVESAMEEADFRRESLDGIEASRFLGTLMRHFGEI